MCVYSVQINKIIYQHWSPESNGDHYFHITDSSKYRLSFYTHTPTHYVFQRTGNFNQVVMVDPKKELWTVDLVHFLVCVHKKLKEGRT